MSRITAISGCAINVRPYHANSAFHPVIAQIARAAGFEQDEPADVKLDKLESVLRQSTTDLNRVVPLIAAMMALPQDRYPPLDMSPQRQKDETIAVLADQVAGLSQDRPVLMLFEDAHWSDPTSLEVLGSTINRLQDQAVLLVITFRPMFEPPWTGHGHVVAQSLGRLGRRQGAEIITRVTGGKTLPGEVLDQIVAKTDGVPLFVEELTKTVLEAGFLTDTGAAYTMDGPLPPLAIPATLKDSLMARLDRLAPDKEVAQIGACIGREFPYPLLAAVSPLADNQLEDSLQQLVNSELIFRRGSLPDATYTFKHALVQDVAYESLLNSRRQQTHQRIATAIEETFPELFAADASVPAHHYTQAGLIEQALPFWLAAGHQARDRMAYPEAASHLSEGLRLIAGLPEGTERDNKELEFLLALGPVQTGIKGHGGDDVELVYRRTDELCQKIGDKDQRTNSFFGMMSLYLDRLEISKVVDLIQARLADAVETNDPTELLRGYELHAFSEMYSGRWVTALQAANRAISYYDPLKHRDLVFETGRGSGMLAHNTKAYCAWTLGYPIQGLGAAMDAISIAEQAAHPQDLLYVLENCGADLHHLAGQVEMTLTFADRVHNLGIELGSETARAKGAFLAGLAKSRLGDVDGGLDQMVAGLAALRATGTVAQTGRYAADLGEAYGMVGRPKTGLDVIAKAQAERPIQFAEIFRIQGDLYRRSDDDDEAEQSYRRAIDIAREEGRQDIRAACGHGARAFVTRSRQGRCGPHASVSGLRVVHRRLRVARSDRCEGVA